MFYSCLVHDFLCTTISWDGAGFFLLAVALFVFGVCGAVEDFVVMAMNDSVHVLSAAIAQFYCSSVNDF